MQMLMRMLMLKKRIDADVGGGCGCQRAIGLERAVI
jgi:hypothetical protein